jgi:hypothetical protein
MTPLISEGSLSFRSNGTLHTALPTHARGYAVKQTSVAFINGANSENMVIGAEWKGVKGRGTFLISHTEGKAEFTINHKTYFVKQSGNYLKIVISEVNQYSSFLLLTGTFEGQLEDKNGNKIVITEGKFATHSL